MQAIAGRFSLFCATVAGSTTVAYSEWGVDLLPLPWANDANRTSGEQKKQRRAGTVYAWGPFFGGKHASKVADLPPAVHVAVCNGIGAAVRADGTVHAFTGSGTTSEVKLRHRYRAVSTAVRSNPESIAILDESGTVHVSEKEKDEKLTFAPAKALRGAMRRARIVDVDCGPNHCVAVSDGGEAFTWGASNSHAQLRNAENDGDGNDTEIPRKVEIPRNNNKIVQASCGLNHSLFLDSEGVVYGMGDDKWTQLARNAEPWIGNSGNVAERNGFGKAELINDLPVAAIECGDDHSVFLVKDGTVFSCGTNSYGQLGHHNFCTFAPPSPVADIAIRARTISAGGDSTCVIDTLTGFVRCIGSSGNGQPSKKWKYLREKYGNAYLNPATAVAQGGASFAAIVEDIPNTAEEKEIR